MSKAGEDYCATVLIVNKTVDEAIFIKKSREPHKKFPSGKEITIPSRWGFAGGRKDPGDKNEIHTAKREVKEEIGAQVEIVPDLKVVERGEDHLNILFLGYLADGSRKPRPNNEEVIDVRWLPIQVLKDLYLFKKILGDREMMYDGHRRRGLKLLWLYQKSKK